MLKALGLGGFFGMGEATSKLLGKEPEKADIFGRSMTPVEMEKHTKDREAKLCYFAREILNYIRHPIVRMNTCMPIQMPFASVPINIYAKQRDWAKQVPEPKIHELVEELKHYHFFTGNSTTVMQYVFNSLPSPKGFTQVKELQLVPPMRAQRIVSPRYCVDIAELNCYGMASMLASVAFLKKELEQASNIVMVTSGDRDSVGQHTDVQIYAKTEAYFVEVFAWIDYVAIMSDSTFVQKVKEMLKRRRRNHEAFVELPFTSQLPTLGSQGI